MGDLRKLILFVAVSVASYCTVGFSSREEGGKLSGRWQETYFNELAEPVITEGYYTLKQKDDEITILHKSSTKEIFSHIHLVDAMFTFQRTKYTDSVELVMAYNLQPNEDWSALYGSYYSSEGREVRVVWNKQMKKS